MRSVFGQILVELLAESPGMRGAILADLEGEQVDLASTYDPFEMRLAGAHWGVIFYLARASMERSAATTCDEMVLCFPQMRVFVLEVTEHYFVLATADSDIDVDSTLSAMQHTRARLLAEM